MTRNVLAIGMALLSFLLAGGARAQSIVAPAQARAIAKAAYIYGSPMVDHHRIRHTYFVDSTSPEFKADSTSPEFKAPWNEVKNIPRVYTPEDKVVQTPNSPERVPRQGQGIQLAAGAEGPVLAMRLYWPKDEALNGTWTAPPLKRM